MTNVRLIPARAGNTDRQRALGRGLPAHPRSRGEHDKLLQNRGVTDGSSPLARGTQVTKTL